MSRPATKSDLVKAANEQYDKLQQLIDSLTEAEQNAAFAFGGLISAKKEMHWKRDNNLRDILIHLYEWHQLLLSWAVANQHGEAKPFLPAPYNWKTYPDMNREFWQKHQSTPLTQAKQMLQESHQKVMALITQFSDQELFEKKYFTWTGTTNLGSYCISATSSHYDWALKKLKLHIKTLRK